MNDQFTFNELDSAFKKGIESLELDPNERSWKKVEAGISNMENVMMRKRIRKLKIISSFLGTCVISLGLFMIYHYSNGHNTASADKLMKQDIVMSSDLSKNEIEKKQSQQNAITSKTLGTNRTLSEKKKNTVSINPIISNGGTKAIIQPQGKSGIQLNNSTKLAKNKNEMNASVHPQEKENPQNLANEKKSLASADPDLNKQLSNPVQIISEQKNRTPI